MNMGRIFLMYLLLLLGSVFTVEGLLLFWFPIGENAWQMITFGLIFLLIYLFLKMCYTTEKNKEPGGKQ